MEQNCQCRLCRQFFSEEEMSEEHYPAKSVGNDDVIALDIVKMFDSFQTKSDYSGGFRATCPDFESHHSGATEPPANSLFHGALDMSLCRS